MLKEDDKSRYLAPCCNDPACTHAVVAAATLEATQLSDKEREIILGVLGRDELLRREQEVKVFHLKAELQSLRRKGALKPTAAQTSDLADPGPDLDRTCGRCRTELGRVINRGAYCRACRLRVCKSCREYSSRTTDWVCTVCHKHMEIQVASGEWMNEFVRRPSRRRDNRVYVPTADIIKRTIRRSWTISNPTPRWSAFRRSPEHRPYNSLPRAGQDITTTYPSLLPHRVNSKNDPQNALSTSPLAIRRNTPTRRTQSEDIYEDRVPPSSPRLAANERPVRVNPLIMLAAERKSRKRSPKHEGKEDGSGDSRNDSEKEDEEDRKKVFNTPESIRKLDKASIEKRVSFDRAVSDKISFSPEKSVFRTQSLNEKKKRERLQSGARSLMDDYSDREEAVGPSTEVRYGREEVAPMELCDIEPLSGTVFCKVSVRRGRQERKNLAATDNGWRRSSQTDSDNSVSACGDILLPSCDDYRLVFVGSSDGSSKEEDGDDSSSTASSFPPLTDECDWDYFEPGAGAVRLVTWGSPFGSPGESRRVQAAASTTLLVDSPLGSPLVYRRRLLDSDTGTGTDEDIAQPDSSPASSTTGEISLRCFHAEDTTFHQRAACHACGASTQFIPIPVPIPVPYPVHEWAAPPHESMMLYDAARLRSLPRTFWPPTPYLGQALLWPTLYTQLGNRNATARPDRDDDAPADSSSVAVAASAETDVRKPPIPPAAEEVSGYLECEYGDSDSSDSSSEDELPIRRVYDVNGRGDRQSDDALPSSNVTSDDDHDSHLSQSSHREDDMSSSGSTDTDSDDTGTVADRPKKFSRIFVVNKNVSSSSSSNASSSGSDTDSSDNDTDTEMDCMVVLKRVKQLSEESSEKFEGCDNGKVLNNYIDTGCNGPSDQDDTFGGIKLTKYICNKSDGEDIMEDDDYNINETKVENKSQKQNKVTSENKIRLDQEVAIIGSFGNNNYEINETVINIGVCKESLHNGNDLENEIDTENEYNTTIVEKKHIADSINNTSQNSDTHGDVFIVKHDTEEKGEDVDIDERITTTAIKVEKLDVNEKEVIELDNDVELTKAPNRITEFEYPGMIHKEISAIDDNVELSKNIENMLPDIVTQVEDFGVVTEKLDIAGSITETTANTKSEIIDRIHVDLDRENEHITFDVSSENNKAVANKENEAVTLELDGTTDMLSKDGHKQSSIQDHYEYNCDSSTREDIEGLLQSGTNYKFEKTTIEKRVNLSDILNTDTDKNNDNATKNAAGDNTNIGTIKETSSKESASIAFLEPASLVDEKANNGGTTTISGNERLRKELDKILVAKESDYVSSSPGLSDVSAESLSSSDFEGRLDEEETMPVPAGFVAPVGDDDRRRHGERNAGDVEGVDTLRVPQPGVGTTSSPPVGADSAECAVRCASGNNNAAGTRYTSLVMITQEPAPTSCYQQVSVVTTDTTRLVEGDHADVVVRHTNWQEEAARRSDRNVDNDNQNKQGESVTVITGGETLSAFEEGLADDDSWVENLSHGDEDDDDDDDNFENNSPSEDSSSGEEVTLTCSAAIDQEDELRGYHRSAIDFTLHTIVEESCEESEVEQNATKRKERPASATDLEKYFFFGLGDGIVASSNKEDAFSETSSIYSEGMESLGGTEDSQPQSQNDNCEPAEMASSRLEKYFLSGFMGFTNERRDSDGSVGSDSEGKPSPEQRRKRLVRARGTGRSHSSSLDNLDNAGNEQTAEMQINSEDSSSSDSDTYDEINSFEKPDGQFDTVKRKKCKKQKNPSSPGEEGKNLETTQEVDEKDEELDEDEDRNKTPQPEIPAPSNLTTNKNQQSRDSGFIGSCDDLIKEQRDNTTPESIKTEIKTELENIAEEKKIDERKTYLSTPPTTSLTRKDSFNNWSSDEETNLMMSKMRQFFKTMVGNPSAKTPTTTCLNARMSPKPLPSPKSRIRCKPPQLVYFENELTRLMKTVPGLRDDQVRELVEYLSSEDTWSDSYDSSDYTSSDLEGASSKSALQQEISDSCKQIINKFDASVDDEGDEGDGGIHEDGQGLNRETAFVYQKLVASFEKMATGDGEPGKVPKLTPQNSPQLIAKVMHHIGSRLVALMHEVSSGESHASNSPRAKHYHRRLQHKISSASSTTTEDDCPESTFMGLEDNVTKAYNLLPRSRSHDLLVGENRTANQTGVSDSVEEREVSDCERFSWRGSFESALIAADSRSKLSSLGGDVSSSASALAIAAKRRSAGDLLFSHKSLSREQLDRVRSCGSIGGANSEDKLWVASAVTRPNRRRSSVPDAVSCGSGGSADGEEEDDEMETRSTLPRSLQSVAQSTNSLPRLPLVVGMQKSQSMYHFLPQNVKSARYRPPGFSRLLPTAPQRAVSAPGLQPSHQRRGRRSQQHNVPIDAASDDIEFALVSYVKDVKSTPEGSKIRTIIIPTEELLNRKVRLKCSNRNGTERLDDFDDEETDKQEHEKKIETSCSSDAEADCNSGVPQVQIQDDVSITEAHSSPTLASRSGGAGGGSKSATPSPVAPSSRRTTTNLSTSSHEWHGDDDIDRLVGLHGRTSLSSLGLRSDSMASVYSGAGGEGRYGAVAVRGQVEFGLQYNYKAGALEVHVCRCKDLAAVDAKRSRSDPYVKAYLLPDRSKGGKRKTKVKKHTLNPVFDECLRFHISLNGLETRTLWLTVWHSDMFGRNDFLGEVMMALEDKVFDDPTPKWYNLQERSEPFEDVQSFKGDIIVCLKFVPPDMTVQKKGKRSRGALHVLIKEAKSLTAVKANGTSDPFCKSYLLPDKGRSSKQKTPIARRTVNPVWNYTFIYDDVTLQELAERSLELTVWDHDRLASNEFLGGVRFSLGTGKHYGKTVEWMDASGKELNLWKSMLERPNFWVEGCLSLRPTLDARPS